MLSASVRPWEHCVRTHGLSDFSSFVIIGILLAFAYDRVATTLGSAACNSTSADIAEL